MRGGRRRTRSSRRRSPNRRCHWGRTRTPALAGCCGAPAALPESDTGDVLWLRNHPVRLFDVMGVVVGSGRARRRWPTARARDVHRRQHRAGRVRAVAARVVGRGPPGKRPRPQAEVAAELDALRLGALVHVHGTFRRFRDAAKSVERLWREADPNAECVHWLRCRASGASATPSTSRSRRRCASSRPRATSSGAAARRPAPRRRPMPARPRSPTCCSPPRGARRRPTDEELVAGRLGRRAARREGARRRHRAPRRAQSPVRER